MIVKVGGKVMEIIKTDQSYGWNRVEVPDISQAQCTAEWHDIDSIGKLIDAQIPICLEDKSSFGSIVKGAVHEFDIVNYQALSDHAYSDFLYRLPSWGVEKAMDSFVSSFIF